MRWKIQVEKEERCCSEHFLCSSVCWQQPLRRFQGLRFEVQLHSVKTGWFHLCCLWATCLPWKCAYSNREFGGGKSFLCQCVTSHCCMKWHVLKLFWALMGSLAQTTQKLVCFLPQFVNRVLWVGFDRCRLVFSPWHSLTCRLMLPPGKGAKI